MRISRMAFMELAHRLNVVSLLIRAAVPSRLTQNHRQPETDMDQQVLAGNAIETYRRTDSPGAATLSSDAVKTSYGCPCCQFAIPIPANTHIRPAI
jgi:hypothetical protein